MEGEVIFWYGVGVGAWMGASATLFVLYCAYRCEPKVLRDAQEVVDECWGADMVTYRRGR